MKRIRNIEVSTRDDEIWIQQANEKPDSSSVVVITADQCELVCNWLTEAKKTAMTARSERQ